MGLVYKLTIPQNSIYRYLLDNINENFDIKYDTHEDGQDTDKDSILKTDNIAVYASDYLAACFFIAFFSASIFACIDVFKFDRYSN